MFDVIPFWMWAVGLLLLALVCDAASTVHGHQRKSAHARQAQQRVCSRIP
jgi:hypothetical protein